MAETEPASFDELYRTGREAIRSPYMIKREHVILHTWGYALGGGTDVAWTIISETTPHRYHHDKTYVVQRVTWEPLQDMLRLRQKATTASAQPNLSVERADLDTTEFLRYANEGKAITIPLIGVEPDMGTDGSFHGIQLTDSYGGFNLTWWTFPPKEWEPLVEWVRNLTMYLDRHFEDDETT